MSLDTAYETLKTELLNIQMKGEETRLVKRVEDGVPKDINRGDEGRIIYLGDIQELFEYGAQHAVYPTARDARVVIVFTLKQEGTDVTSANLFKKLREYTELIRKRIQLGNNPVEYNPNGNGAFLQQHENPPGDGFRAWVEKVEYVNTWKAPRSYSVSYIRLEAYEC